MYIGETELERQTRLQSDADAERALDTLRQGQIGQLPEIEVKGNPTVFFILTAAVLTGLLFPLSGKRRTLWMLFALVPSMLAAQTFQQTLVSGPDTFTVYGRYGTVTTTTVTVDSVILKPSTAPGGTAGFLYGPTSGFDAPILAPFTATGGVSSGTPAALLDNIAKSRQRKIPFIANLPCGSHNVSNLGKCLALIGGVLTFNQSRFDLALAPYNTTAIRAAVAQAVKDSLLLAINLMDEPWVSGGGDGNTWGKPGTMTRARVDSLCRSARAIFGPTVPLGTSDQTGWQRTGTWKWCDVGIAQFSYRFGNPKAWRDSILSVSSAQGYQSIFSHNFINGGTQDKVGAWDCPGGVKGQRAPNCQMTPTQIVGVTDTLGASGCGVFTMWRYDSARMALPGYATAFATAAAVQLKRPRKLCKVRS